ncbi:MAG: hypothetical protein Q9217_003379 [Psora testacea]
MSSPAPRRSVDTYSSPYSSPSSNQYPFPQLSSLPTSTTSGRYGRRRGSSTSTVASIGGVLDTSAQNSDSIAEGGSNAIATLLQPPIVRTGLLPTAGLSAQKQPSTKDIPPVTLTNIPHVDPSAFSSYLKEAGSLYDAFQRAKEGEGEPGTQGRRPLGLSKNDQLQSPLLQSYPRRKGSAPSTPTLDTGAITPSSPPERPLAKKQPTGRRRGLLPVAPLSTIPNVYFEPEFHLENPRTFDIVSERSEIVRPPGTNGAAITPGSSGRKALATNAILQEKLSWYMDTIEVHLISSISTASSSFFAALGSLRELHLEAAASVAKIKLLREDLESLDKSMAQGGLKIVAFRRRRENMRKLGDAVEQLREVVEAVVWCEEQVDQGEIEEALNGLTAVESLIAGERRVPSYSKSHGRRVPQDRLIDLRGINALDGTGDDMAYLRQKIGKSFETRFLDALLDDLRNHVDSVSPSTTFQRWDSASQRSRGSHARTPSIYPTYLQLDDTLRSKLQSNLEGLAKSDSLKQATTAYREALWREVKTLIRRHFPSSTDDDVESSMSTSTPSGRRMTQQEKSSVLARNLRDLDPQDAEEMLRKIYSNVGEALRRLGTQVKVVLDITSTFSTQTVSQFTSPKTSPAAHMGSSMNGAPIGSPMHSSIQQEDIQQTLDMSNLLGQAVDIAQAQITKVLKVRSEQSVQLPLPKFLKYFHLNRLFADECEAVSGRAGMALKTVVNSHIKDFVHRTSDLERQKLVESMDADRWDAKDFAETDSQLLGQIIEASTRDLEAWSKGSVIWSEQDTAINGEQQLNSVSVNGAEQTPKDKVRSASINDQTFILPESGLVVLRGVSSFEKIIVGIPSMAQEIATALLEYLKLFNSRSQQLILGAGATRMAGLKNITTKHLALASQALSFVTALTPYIREFVRRHLTNAQSLMIEFDKVRRLYQEHQSGINDKLVDIMSSRASTHVNTMKKMNWDAPSTGDAVSPYMETLVKETTTLHKVLSKHLPEMTVRAIMDPVFASYGEQWSKAFHEVGVKTAAGKERLLRDAEYFKSRISKVNGAGDVGGAVIDAVHDRSVAEEKQPHAENAKVTDGTEDKPMQKNDENK